MSALSLWLLLYVAKKTDGELASPHRRSMIGVLKIAPNFDKEILKPKNLSTVESEYIWMCSSNGLKATQVIFIVLLPTLFMIKNESSKS